MREQLVKALLAHAQGDIQKHVANVEVYLSNPAGIGEHSDITEAIENELNIIAKYDEQVAVLKKYFLRVDTPVKRTRDNAYDINMREANASQS